MNPGQPRQTKTQARQRRKAAAMANPSPAVPDAGPYFADRELVGRICARIVEFCPRSTACECEGIAASNASNWLDRAEEPGASPDLVFAAAEIRKAEAIRDATLCRMATLDGKGAQWMLERLNRGEFGREQKVTIDTAGVVSADDVLSAIARPASSD